MNSVPDFTGIGLVTCFDEHTIEDPRGGKVYNGNYGNLYNNFHTPYRGGDFAKSFAEADGSICRFFCGLPPAVNALGAYSIDRANALPHYLSGQPKAAAVGDWAHNLTTKAGQYG